MPEERPDIDVTNAQVVYGQTTPERQAADTNRASIEDQARQALATNRTYVALASPTAAQTAAEVKALARQNNGLIRLLLGLLDATD